MAGIVLVQVFGFDVPTMTFTKETGIIKKDGNVDRTNALRTEHKAEAGRQGELGFEGIVVAAGPKVFLDDD